MSGIKVHVETTEEMSYLAAVNHANEMRAIGEHINDAAVLAIARAWGSDGAAGHALAALANGYWTNAEDLGLDIANAMMRATDPGDKSALAMLRLWVTAFAEDDD